MILLNIVVFVVVTLVLFGIYTLCFGIIGYFLGLASIIGILCVVCFLNAYYFLFVRYSKSLLRV